MIFKNFKRQKMNKKGDIQDLIMIAVFIVGFAMAGIIAYKFFGDFTEKVADTGTFSDDAMTTMNETQARMPPVFDGGLLVVFVLATLVMLISAWFVDVHPAIFIMAFIIVVAIIIIAGAMSNAYQEFTQQDALLNESAEFPMTNFMINNLPVIILIIGIALTIVLFAKFRFAQGGY
jgi:hypothetical protein